MRKNENQSRKPSIHIQAVMAMMFILFVHKLVREIPGSLDIGSIGGIATITAAAMLALGIALLFFRNRWGLILGFVPAVWAMLQWILVHVIWARPDQNGVWWYPIFPIVQGVLIIYFSILAWRDDESFSRSAAEVDWLKICPRLRMRTLEFVEHTALAGKTFVQNDRLFAGKYLRPHGSSG